jgi:large subunit ribosomal protein L18
MANSKRELFQKRRLRNRNKIARSNGRPRLSVHRSNKNISVQLIDDVEGDARLRLVARKDAGRGRQEQRRGRRQGRRRDCRAREEGRRRGLLSSTVAVFLFHGRVKALADAAREGGLKF